MKSPAFQFYPAEFLADENVVLMSNQELGCYIKLMCYCWREGSIPSSVDKIARLCGEDGSAMAQLWQAISYCFQIAINDDTRLVHPRLEKERLKQEERRKERSESGKRGAISKWNKEIDSDGSANGSAIKQPMAKDGSSISSSSSSSNKPSKPPKGDSDDRFETFWKAYPSGCRGKSGKAYARKCWSKLNPDLAVVLKALEWQKLSDQWKKDGGQYIPNPATWLNQGRWSDEPVDPLVAGSKEKPWFICGWSAIVEKGKEAGIVEIRDLHGQYLKAAIFRHFGITMEMEEKAKREWEEK